MPQRHPTWDYPRSVFAARLMAEVGTEYGYPVERVLVASGLRASDLDDSERVVEAGQELAVARNLVAALGDPPGLGVEVASRTTLSSFGLFGFALASSPTIGDALRLAMRCMELGHAFVQISLEESPHSIRATFDHRGLPEDVRDFLLERDIGVILGVFAPAFIGPAVLARLPEAQLELSLTEARGAAVVTLPGVRTSFNRPRTVLTFPADVLDQPCALPDRETARVCEQQCLKLLERRRRRTGLADLVRTRLLRNPATVPTAAEIAAELHIDRRTLQRRLAAEGTSVRELRAEVRHTLAVELLTNLDMSVEEIGRRLGYSSPSAFTHAFTRWTGSGPHAYRRTVRLEPTREVGTGL